MTLTSYPKRFPTLHPTLTRLLSQTVRPDHVTLWLSRGDRAALPQEVEALTTKGLTIFETEEVGPHKKYLGARTVFPSAFLVTVDDDIAYSRKLLSELIAAYSADERAVVARRGGLT